MAKTFFDPHMIGATTGQRGLNGLRMLLKVYSGIDKEIQHYAEKHNVEYISKKETPDIFNEKLIEFVTEPRLLIQKYKNCTSY